MNKSNSATGVGGEAVGTYLESIGSAVGASNAQIVGLIVDVKNFADSTIGTAPEGNNKNEETAYPAGRVFTIQSAQDEQRRLLGELRVQVGRLFII